MAASRPGRVLPPRMNARYPLYWWLGGVSPRRVLLMSVVVKISDHTRPTGRKVVAERVTLLLWKEAVWFEVGLVPTHLSGGTEDIH
jgi:hypothetical protein